ncbi:diguanylate cyclase [Agrobacterium larrymoorei]|uniref:sensor domain-containing diguanylate cyclase n=1 Tax=Agrobacterium larrymoorei TaxID=160699 RepID=UPI0030BA5233
MIPSSVFKGLMASLLLVMVALFSAAVAGAADSANIRASCWATAAPTEDLVAVVRDEPRWSCSGTRQTLSIDAERVLLRFDIDADRVLPQYLLSRRSALEAVHLLAVDDDGAVRQASYPGGALNSSMDGGYFFASLPAVTSATRQVVAAFDLPTHRMTLENAFLSPTDTAAGTEDLRFLLLLAALAGMLVMPLIFNAAFYRVLRQPFVLWHTALTLSLMMTIVVSSGLAVAFFDPPALRLSWMTTLIFGMTIGSGAMFTYSFIEPGLMHPLLRRVLPYCAAWAMLLAVFHASFPFVARPIQSAAYTAGFVPVLAVFLLAMFDSLYRGSRAARFQMIGYAPLAVVGAIRVVTGITPSLQIADAMLLFYFGCMFEIVMTTLGVADRFVIIRRERDRARSEAELLERLSQTDPLTGLRNRRALERQFKQLRTEGFIALAAIDLDHFKAINDRYGHHVGDEVLKAVAVALNDAPDVRAYRLGGEEFVLLLRGDDVVAQAELRRQAIPGTISTVVPGLETPVTASMGIMSISGDEDLASLYERADRLLYEAKDDGRNKTHSAVSATAPPKAVKINKASRA